MGLSVKEHLTAESEIIGSKSKIKRIKVEKNLALLNSAKIKYVMSSEEYDWAF